MEGMQADSTPNWRRYTKARVCCDLCSFDYSTPSAVQLSQMPVAAADSGLYPVCLGIRVAQPKLQTRHSPHTGDQRHYMTETSVF